MYRCSIEQHVSLKVEVASTCSVTFKVVEQGAFPPVHQPLCHTCRDPSELNVCFAEAGPSQSEGLHESAGGLGQGPVLAGPIGLQAHRPIGPAAPKLARYDSSNGCACFAVRFLGVV